MPSWRQRLSSHGRFTPTQLSLKEVLSSKLARVVSGALLLFVLAFVSLRYRATHNLTATSHATPAAAKSLTGSADSSSNPRKGRLHLLIPATSTNPDLCKLLLSAEILNYPTPILINYGAPEAENAYVQHLAKVEGILKYLETIETSSDYAEDLVLILDGYDIWFQLRPDVLLKRYYEVNNAANERWVNTYGEQMVEHHGIRQTIIFGPDKICWPIDFSRPACWAVPIPDMPEYAFGPQTAQGREEMNMPRWLNSGTIMGPALDLREMFRATLEWIHTNYTTDSDQFYFANIFGNQEVARMQLKPDLIEEYKGYRYQAHTEAVLDTGYRYEPNVTGVRTEYHIGIDHTSTLFQTIAFWHQYLTWMRPIDSWMPTQPQGVNLQYGNYHNPRLFTLTNDILKSAPPFEVLKGVDDQAAKIPWTEVELLYNTITGVAPVTIHFAARKQFRQIWWQRMWFQAKAEQLRSNSSHVDTRRISYETIGGYQWYNAEPTEAAEVSVAGKGGAWSDTGGWFSWRVLCKPFEEGFYNVPGDEFYHAPPFNETEQTILSGG